MLEAMGIKLLIIHNATPTTISATTMFIKGIFFYSPKGLVSNALPNWRPLLQTVLTKNPASLNQPDYQYNQAND